jgi:predicted acylesterase/phospholipase RssA
MHEEDIGAAAKDDTPKHVELTLGERLLPVDPKAASDLYAGRNVKLVLTLQGGGAKGIVHLGAYREIEAAGRVDRPPRYSHWPKYEIRAYSGTSIGALVAALICAGYSADEILSERPVSDQTDGKGWKFWRRQRLNSVVLENAKLRHVMQLFGHWRLRFYLLRWFLTHPLPVLVIGALAWFLAIVVLHERLIEWFANISEWADPINRDWVPPQLQGTISSIIGYLGSAGNAPTFAILLVGLLSIAFTFLVLRHLVRGLYSMDRLVEALDRALAAKLRTRFESLARYPHGRPGRIHPDLCRQMAEECKVALGEKAKNYKPVVTFQMMRSAECRPIAIAATDISKGSVRLFSTHATPRQHVAVAVAASAAVPFLFRPVRVFDGEEHFLFDGGFTSNLPAWPFDIQREINPDLFTMAIEIPGRTFEFDRIWKDVTTWWPFQPFRQLRALVNAAVFGARILETRRTRAITIQIEPTVDLLHFDMSAKTALAQVEEARRCFRSSLNLRIARRQLYASTSNAICQAVLAHLERSPYEGQESGFEPRIRVRLFRGLGDGPRAVKSVWHFSTKVAFQMDTDDRLLYRVGSSVPGHVGSSVPGDAWQDSELAIIEVGRNPTKVIRDEWNPEQVRYAQRLVWDECEWMLRRFIPRNPAVSEKSADWVVVVDSNIKSHCFDFSQDSKRRLVTKFEEVAKELDRLEEEAERKRVTLDQEMAA